MLLYFTLLCLFWEGIYIKKLFMNNNLYTGVQKRQSLILKHMKYLSVFPRFARRCLLEVVPIMH